MKCLMCGASVRPVKSNGIKTCPKCKAILGSLKVEPQHKLTNLQMSFTIPELGADRPKDKAGKYQPHLVLGSLTRAVARVREYGVLKYHGENGWKQQTAQDYMDAIGRHYDECRNSITARDTESGLLHIAQIATNAMFIIDMLKEQGIDFDFMNKPEERKSDGN